MSMFPIASVTVGSGGATSLAFTSIPQTFTHLQIRLHAITASANLNIFSTINGVGYGNYARHWLQGDGSAANSVGVTNDAPIISYVTTASTSFPQIAILDILDYSNTNKYKVGRIIAGRDCNGSGTVGLLSWSNQSLSAVTSISIDTFYSTQFAQYTRADLYGIQTSNATGA